MTIRYTCTGCESVLKIKDEKAGSKGKCPKCKLEFLVPNPEEADDEADADLAPAPMREVEPEESVDMPIELTPDVPESDDFDPMAVLGAPSPSTGRNSSFSNPGRGESADRKASVADMMKDFEAAKKKDKGRSGPEASRPTVSSMASETTGTAADALSRAYQQKRDSASLATKSVKDVKAAEERALLMDFVKTRLGPAVLVISAVLYGYYWWMTREVYTGPPLFAVTGQVLKNGTAASGVRIVFEPISAGPDDPRSSAMGSSDAEGKFTLMYTPANSGAPAGEYRVLLTNENGIPVSPAAGALTLTVQDGQPNEFKIDL